LNIGTRTGDYGTGTQEPKPSPIFAPKRKKPKPNPSLRKCLGFRIPMKP
jgi:hypothetical protein